MNSWLDDHSDSHGYTGAAAARERVGRPVEEDLWRQGHRRPWWMWNVLSLFAALFALVWLRFLFSLPQSAVWILCFAIIGGWLFLPLYKTRQRSLLSVLHVRSGLTIVKDDLRRLQDRRDLGWAIRLACYVAVVYLAITILLVAGLVWRRALMETWEILRLL